MIHDCYGYFFADPLILLADTIVGKKEAAAEVVVVENDKAFNDLNDREKHKAN